MKLDIENLDFEHCEEERIHKPELIQSYGYLFALDRKDGTIQVLSENVKDLLGANRELIGKDFFSFLEHDGNAEFLKESYERAQNTKTRLPVYVNFKPELIQSDQKNNFYAIVYSSEDLFVVELEPSARFRETYSAMHHMKLYATSIAPKFKMVESLAAMASEMVNTLRYITNMDRVVLYKFSHDGSGKVLAESKIEGIDSYLDLHYPASDIPKQARELYKKNWIRLMANVDLEPSKLIPSPAESGRKPLDMTYSLLRDLSPIHKQYIRNQGLSSSLSMSLVTHGELWGMISCHSKKPRYIPQNVRLECENLSQLFSWHIYAKEEELLLERTTRTDKAIMHILDKTAPKKSIVEVFEENQQEVLEVLDADGFIFYSSTEQIKLGKHPHLSVVKEIYEKHYNDRKGVFYTDNLNDYISEEGRLNGICGLMMMSIGGNSKNFTAWFRKERKQIQKWAGVPKEKSPIASKAERLTPRSSFKIHEIEISGKSKLWDSQDVDVATRFNKVFMSYAFEKQETLRSDINYLQLQNKYVNDFLATLAHELRNPLAPISTGLSLMEEVDNPEMKKEFMNTMKRQVDHMTTMIDDLMDVSRITQNKVKLSKEKLDLRSVLKDAVNSCQSTISKNEHQLKIDLPNHPVFIIGDRTRLNQVFVNLLTNASKYTSPGGNIQVSLSDQDKLACVKVKDDGVGIEADQLEEIFTMFTQMNSLSSQSKSGLGIGLTLVKRLLELHDAEIKAYSDGLGSGSEFEILIPSVTHSDSEPDANSAEAQPEEPTTDNSNVRILVVDDNEDLTRMLKIILEKKSFKVEVAYDGKEGLELFKKSPPHYAIIDLGLPDMDGFELCEKMKEIANGDDTIFFSHSGLGQSDKIKKSARTGFKKHFVKPVKVEVLIDSINEYKSK